LKKSILKIVGGFDDGGVYTCEQNFVAKLQEKGFSVDLIIVGKGDRCDDYKAIADNHIVLDNLESKLSGSVITVLKEVLKIRRFGQIHYRTVSNVLRKKYYAILYRRPMYMFLAVKLAKIYGCRSFWHTPNIVSNRFSKMFYTAFVYRYRTVPIANSHFTKKTIGRICKDVVYPGYSKERVRRSSINFREQLNIPPGAPVYGIAGRICFDKAQDIVIEAFCNADIIANGGHLVIAGGHSTLEFFEKVKKIAYPYVGKNIHFLGRIQDLPMFYSTIDVAINGRRNVEAFGISVAEALGAKKPVIAYHLGGPSEMIKHGANGWLVRNPTVENFKEILNLSFNNKENWGGMVTDETTLKMLSVDYNVDKLIKIMEEVYAVK